MLSIESKMLHGSSTMVRLQLDERQWQRVMAVLVQRASSCILADKAYDSDPFRAALERQGCLPVIPSNGSRAGKLPYDKQLYKSRSEIECTFNLLKQARRFASL